MLGKKLDVEFVVDRVLLTNDDGFDAPGLKVLEQVAKTLARDVWIVAPEKDQSGVSHAISLHSPIRITKRGFQCFAVTGTPGDCVMIAVRHLMLECLPDLILSGINRGANLGVETVFSGTVGAAMVGLLLGFPSIALSQAFAAREDVPWETSSKLAGQTIRDLLKLNWEGSACLNVNFPPCLPDQAKPLKLTSQGVGHLSGADVIACRDPREFSYYWLKLTHAERENVPCTEAMELGKCHITASPLEFERTNEAVLERMCQMYRPLAVQP